MSFEDLMQVGFGIVNDRIGELVIYTPINSNAIDNVKMPFSEDMDDRVSTDKGQAVVRSAQGIVDKTVVKVVSQGDLIEVKSNGNVYAVQEIRRETELRASIRAVAIDRQELSQPGYRSPQVR